MLHVSEVSAYYGSIQALDEVSLSVSGREIVTLIGANGAGKTTLLNTICGSTRARRGQIVFDERAITHLPVERIVRLGISHVPEGRQIFGSMSTLDNLILGAYLRYGREEREAIEADLDLVLNTFPILKERQTQAAGTLSGGEQQMLAIARSLMSSPRLLLLDEPLMGLAPFLVKEILELLERLRDRGIAILLVEQDSVQALRIADRAYVMETGRIVAHGSAVELMGSTLVRRAYLGQRDWV
jgi:branched-chain amino acid transport system ATP-binding protein